jgi:hypothetical protein
MRLGKRQKNPMAVALARQRWAGRSRAERSRHARLMNAIRHHAQGHRLSARSRAILRRRTQARAPLAPI